MGELNLRSRFSDRSGSGKGKNLGKQIEREIPYATTLIALMAGSGISPYQSFKKLRRQKVLPATNAEASGIVRQVEILGADPLAAMTKTAQRTRSKSFAELLAGYVTTVNGGGSVNSFLKSRLKTAFELQTAYAKQSAEKLGTLVEAYMVMLVIAFTVYIISIVVTTTSFLPISTSSQSIYLITTAALTAMLMLLMGAAHGVWRGTLESLDKVYKGAILPGAISGAAVSLLLVFPRLQISPLNELAAFLPVADILPDAGLPLALGVAFMAVSIKPMLEYQKIARVNFPAESEMPAFIRDVAEARKTGLSPEKCIVYAARRRRSGAFSKRLNTLASQIEWGVSLRDVLKNLERKISSWFVRVNFLILVEIIEAGGGQHSTLEILAESAERSKTIEQERSSLLKPYVIVPFIIVGLLSFTSITLIQTLSQMSSGTLTADAVQSLTEVSLSGIVFHAWLTGFFTGKVVNGSFAAGFRYAVLLVVVALLAIFAATSMSLDTTSSLAIPGF